MSKEETDCPQLTWEEVRRASERALAAAYARGREDGIEAAAKVVEAHWAEQDNCPFDVREKYADDIRALKSSVDKT
jgi:chaperonin GroEL (HSP60 family)